MDITSRPLVEQDIPLICAFPQSEEELFFLFPKACFPLSIASLQKAVAERADATVVTLRNEPVAFANFYHWGNDYCAIGNVIVSPAVRGRGVARYLILRMCELAFEKYQTTEVRISCFNQNVAGLLLYPQLGFQPYAIEERQDKKGNRVALIHMRVLPISLNS